ncbi:hypothetical protein [Rhodococcus qingshengii]|uniref:hypothetical protein n=1 Tax=Rhodococcus qingshengii TaxID=334542 RepID=UPI00157AC6CC|nr:MULTISPECIES: hypothetical protein [Rhodococcus]
MSSARVAESLDESVEDLLPPDLALVRGVVSLTSEGGEKLDGGDEERARLADRLEVAVEFNRARAVAVTEHPAVGFAAKFAHRGGLVLGRQHGG